MQNVVFLEMASGAIETFDVDHRTGRVRSRRTGTSYGSFNQVLASGHFPNRKPAYLLTAGSRPGDDNAWCNFKGLTLKVRTA
jgi:hypothetical protein